MALKAKFKPTPEGEFHPGIPSRDLTEEDYEALDTEQRALVRKSPLYDYRPEHSREEARRVPRSDAEREEQAAADAAIAAERAGEGKS
jgi:hypothetical protein